MWPIINQVLHDSLIQYTWYVYLQNKIMTMTVGLFNVTARLNTKRTKSFVLTQLTDSQVVNWKAI